MRKNNIFKSLLETIRRNTIDNSVTINNVDAFIKSWEREDELEQEEYIDDEGYPTRKYLNFIRGYTPFDEMPILDFVSIIQNNWYHNSSKLIGQYNKKRRFELHTGGWSGNEEIIKAILENQLLVITKMQYVKWEIGGHYYFDIDCREDDPPTSNDEQLRIYL